MQMWHWLQARLDPGVALTSGKAGSRCQCRPVCPSLVSRALFSHRIVARMMESSYWLGLLKRSPSMRGSWGGWAPSKLYQLGWDFPGGNSTRQRDGYWAGKRDSGYSTKCVLGIVGRSSQILWLFCDVFTWVFLHWVVFGLTVAWKEWARCKQLHANSVNHRATGKMPTICFLSLRLRTPRQPGALPHVQPVRRGDEVITCWVNPPLAVLPEPPPRRRCKMWCFGTVRARGGAPQSGAERTLIPPGDSCSNFEGVSLRKGACDLWSKTNLLVGSCSMKWDKVW